MTLRRLCYALSLLASAVAVLSELEGEEHPVLWLAAAVGFLALAGTLEE